MTRRRLRGMASESLEARTLLAGDLVAQWVADDLNSVAGDGEVLASWTDSIGGIDANATGSPVLAKGVLSGRSAVRFDASDGADYFRALANVSPVSDANDFTISVAFMTDSSDLVGNTGPWYENTGLVDGNRLNLGRGWGVTINATGQVSSGLGAGFAETVASVYSSESGLNDGQLHIATLTRSGGTLSMYVDDGAATTITGADAQARDEIDLYIGAVLAGNNPFTGSIAEVRVYNGELTSGEVTTLYQELDSFYNNDAPVAVDDTYNFTEDPAFGFASVSAAEGLLANDTDTEGNALTATLVTPPQQIKVTAKADGSLSLILPNDFFGTDTFTYIANDGQDSNEATVTINVAGVYDGATAVDDTFKLLPTDTLVIPAAQGVLTNDLNPDRASLAAVLQTDVNQGALTLGADGSMTFDPQGQSGFVTFTYQVDDQTNLSSPATVTLIVNTPPEANDDTFSVAEDTTLIRSAANGVLANDSDADGNAVSVTRVDGPLNGTLVLGADGSIDYQPNADYFGPDSFTYRLNDGEDDSQLATASIDVQAVNDPPTTGEDAYFTNTNQVLTVTAGAGVLANDTDIDSASLTASLQSGPSSGSLQLQPDGSFVYTPSADFTGTDTFTYRALDGQDASDPVTVSLLVGEPPVIISEFMAANATILETAVRDDPADSFSREKSTPDWIELKNLTTADLDISGFNLTDEADEPEKWRIPDGTVIPAGGYLVVFADRLNITDTELDEAGLLHTSFKLSVTGEYLAVTSSSGSVIDEYTKYPEQRGDISYGVTPEGARGYLLSPTPGAVNVAAYAGLMPDTAVSVDRGYYDASFPVEITNPDPSATIRYTIDGSEPTLSNGQVYTGSITISGTTVLKAVAFQDGYIPSPIVANSYLFAAQVLLQDDTGLEGSVPWGHQGPDWAMDPIIVNNANPEVRPVPEDLLRIPTVSLSIDTDLFFGQGGIYIRGENVERPVSFEYFDPATPGTSVQTNSTIQIVGGSSPQRWKTDKLSMRVRFTEDEGESELEFPIFGADAATVFDTLVVDARLNNVWSYGGGSEPTGQRGRAQFMRDEFAADLQNEVGGFATNAQHVNVYINGIYWGLHTLHERPDENFNATYQGGEADQYNVIKHRANTVVNGSNDSYMELMSLIGTGNTPIDDDTYAEISESLDIDNFINYLMVNLYGGNLDWDHQNWYASQNPDDGRWRFHSWDAEKVLTNVTDNVTGKNQRNSPTGINRRLMTNPEYQLRFADFVQRNFFNDGAMTPEAAAQLYAGRSDQIDLVTRLESARWGDNQIDNGARKRYTREDWVNNRQGLYDNYFPQRTDRVLSQFSSRGWFDASQSTEFSVNGSPQHGGKVDAGSSLIMAASEGTIFFTIDGSDPRVPGGELAPGARAYSSALTLDAGVTITARMRKDDGTWGQVNRATYTTGLPADGSNLRISEVNYHPSDATPAEIAAGITDADEFEFIELLNISATPIDLSQVRLQRTVKGSDVEGVTFAFADGNVRELAPGERVVVVEDLAAFQVRYGSQINVAGEWSGGLSNKSERIVLMASDQAITDFSYQDKWHATTDGDGPTLQAVNEAGDPAVLGTAAGWRPSSVSGGSPGRSEGPIPGDSNLDGIFNSADLVFVLAAGKYEDGIDNNASFEEGDWDGDGDFTTSDFVFALAAGTYTDAAVPAAQPAANVAATSLFADADEDSRHGKSDAEETPITQSELDAVFAKWL